MATSMTLGGPVIKIADVPQSWGDMEIYLTYIIESQDHSKGTTTIKYSIFDTPYDSRVNPGHPAWGLPLNIGDKIPIQITNPSPGTVTYWYTNPVTENTFKESYNPTWDSDTMLMNATILEKTLAGVITEQDAPGSSYVGYEVYDVVCNRWLLEDAHLIVNSLSSYDLPVSITGYGLDYNTGESYNISGNVPIALDKNAIISAVVSPFTDESTPRMEYINPLGEDIDTLQVGILNKDEDTELVPYRDVEKVKTGIYTFNFTNSERAALYAYLSDSASGIVKFAVKSSEGGISNVSTMSATLNLVNYTPVLAPTIKDINETTVALTGNNQVFIKYHSTANFAVNATARKGTSIASYTTTHGNATYRGATGTVNKVELSKFVLSATDTRGITTSQTMNISLIEYVKLTCNMVAEIPTVNDTIPLTVSGNYWNDSFGAQANTLTIQYRYKSNTLTDYSDWITADVTPTYNGHTYQAVFEASVPNHVDRFTIQTRAVDKLMSIESKEATVQSYPIFDWDADDFNFYVPVSIQDDLSVAGTIYQNGNPMVDFIVDQGTSGIWTYRKWASGIAECWGTVAPAAHSITSSWGSIFTKDNAIARQSYPFTFKDVPVVSINLYNTTGNCWAYTGTVGSTSLSPAFGLARGTSGSVTTGAQITAIGRWK